VNGFVVPSSSSGGGGSSSNVGYRMHNRIADGSAADSIRNNYNFCSPSPSSVSSVSSSRIIERPSYSSSSSSSSRLSAIRNPVPKGCAAVPYDKKKIAVFGVGGYLGTLIFGFLQRASSIYGTGLSGAPTSTPRAIAATSQGSSILNRLLGSHFKLAFAGEEYVRLVDMQDSNRIEECLGGMDAVVIATVCDLERRSITGNSYEKTPNGKTVEFYMDQAYMAQPDEDINGDPEEHLRIFRAALEGCKGAGVGHVVVVETPRTRTLGGGGSGDGGGVPLPQRFASVLDGVGVPFTYIRAGGEGDDWENSKYYTFENGVQSRLNIESSTFAEGYTSWEGYEGGDWMEFFSSSDSDDDDDDAAAYDTPIDEPPKSLKDRRAAANRKKAIIPGKSAVVYREDVAAVVVQSLMSLDWEKSRCLEVSSEGGLNDGLADAEEDSEDSSGGGGGGVKRKRRRKKAVVKRTDGEWCVRSEVLAEILGTCD